MSLYSNAFKLNLEAVGDEFDPSMGPELEPDAEAAAMQDTLEPGTEMDALGTDATAEVADAMAKNNQAMQQKITEWIQMMNEFSERLNEPSNPNSMTSQLKNAVPDTVFDKIRSSEIKKISRVAMEVSALEEIFKGYLASSEDPKYKYV